VSGSDDARARPSGTVALLFTDIQGSTALWEQHREAMSTALARHDEILRQAITSRGGHVFKTVGDAFCAAFMDARDAVAAAVGAQSALGDHAWPADARVRVRMGVHVGVCEERDGDYFGPVVNRAARLSAIAHGGQIVVSAAAAGLASASLGDEIGWIDHGMHRLKDLGRPEHVFQVTASGLEREFPALRSLDNPELRNNLASQISPFIGRKQEVTEVHRLVATHRFVSLVGPGGAGKTRLALHVAADLLDGTGDGVWHVDLAPATHPDVVATTVAATLGLRTGDGQSVTDRLVEVLRDQSMLVVLDNCEHLVDAVAELADAILRRCPGVVLLATSREPLGITGEHVFRVPSLTVPSEDETSVEQLAATDAVALFVDRVAEHRPGFRCDQFNAAQLARLCRRLDGIPLAIELAAARTRTMSLTDLEARLDHRFRLLTGGSRTALKRQQTLQAMMDWSFELLSGPERAALGRLAVFAGSFSMEAAERVLGFGDIDRMDVVDLLSALVDKSLVQLEDAADAYHYRLLETVRDYAATQLARRGDEEADGVRRAHLQYFTDLVHLARSHYRGPAQFEWLDRMAREFDNLRAALAYAMTLSSPDPGLRLGAHVDIFWLQRGGFAELIDALEHLLAGPPAADVEAHAAALVRLAALHAYGGRIRTASSIAADGLARASAIPNYALMVEAGRTIVLAALREGEAAVDMAERCIEYARRSGEELWLADALRLRDMASQQAGHAFPELTETGAWQALQVYRRRGDRLHEARALSMLALLHIGRGEPEAARSMLEEVLVIQGERNVAELTTVVRINMVLADVILGDTVRATLGLVATLAAARRHGQLAAIPYVVMLGAVVLEQQGQARRAVAQHALADRLIAERGEEFEPTEARVRVESLDRLRALLGSTEFDAAYGDGADLDPATVLATIASS
jgi:predicted ATPase/class 3 adenylate cyclase